MRVLHVGEYVQGGVATYIRTLLEHPDCQDVEDFLICADKNSETNWPLPENHFQYYHYHRSFAQIPLAIHAIRKAIKDIRPDVIYCHSTWAGFFVRIPLLFLKKPCRIIYNAHGWAFLRDTAEWKRRFYAIIERILQIQTDAIINVSRYEYNAAVRYGLSKNNQTVIYSGISSKKGGIDPAVKLPERKINLLFVGRFDPQKGLDILLNAFNACKRDDLHLTVIGDNVVGGGIKIEKKNTNRITFLGWVAHEKLASYYVACDAVIMPSRWEAFGLVAIEAMKYGKPVIASNKGALPEIVKDGVNGLIFKVDSSRSFKNLLNCISIDQLQQMGKKSEHIYRNNFQKENMQRMTIKIERGDGI